MKILNAEASRFSPEVKEILYSLGEVVDLDADRDELLKSLEDVEVLIIALRNVIDAEVFSCASSLKYIVTPTTGLNHIDLNIAAEKGVEIISLKGESDFLSTVSATAELTWGVLLCLIRQINVAHEHVMDGGWERNLFYGTELRGKTIGIIGYGRLGKIVAEYGLAFGMSVLVHDIIDCDVNSGAKQVTIDELLAESDIVTIHLPLETDTIGYFDIEKFNKLKKKPIFLNTARGEIVDEMALLHALESGKVSGAGVDVLNGEVSNNDEWLTESMLWKYAQSHTNLLFTPHIGGVTYDSVEKTNLFIIEKLARCLGKELSV